MKTTVLVYFNRARYYSPELSRFISEDPLDFVDGTNLYEYADSDPIDFTDPSGLLVKSPVATAARAAAAATAAPSTGLFNYVCAVATAVGAAAVAILAGASDLNSGEEAELARYRDSMTGRYKDKRGKWHCVAKCHVNNFSNVPNAPLFVTGEGWGNSKGEAELAAEKDANTKVPRGTTKRHCGFKCEKR